MVARGAETSSKFRHYSKNHAKISLEVKNMFSFFPYTKLLKVILMNQAQLAETLNQIAAQNEKSHAEIKAATTKLIDQVADLTAQLLDAPISDEAVAALALVQETAQEIDDLNPDVVA